MALVRTPEYYRSILVDICSAGPNWKVEDPESEFDVYSKIGDSVKTFEDYFRHGWYFFFENHTPKSIDDGYSWSNVICAAKNGHPTARCLIAIQLWRMKHERPIPLGVEEIKAILERSSSRSYSYAHFLLYQIYTDPAFPGMRSLKKGIAHLKEACRLGLATAWCEMAINYSTGTGVEKSERISREYLEKAIAVGYDYAKYLLACSYSEMHYEAPRNIELSLKLLKESKKLRCSDAELLLASCYEKGIYVARSLEKAMKLYKRVARRNVDFAIRMLAKIYFEGRCVDGGSQGLPPDFICKKRGERHRWCVVPDIKVAIEYQKRTDDLWGLAVMYISERNKGQNIEEALSIFQKWIELGDMEAHYQVGMIYLNCLGSYEAQKKAFYFLKFAADKNYVPAMYPLSYCYGNAIGTEYNQERNVFFLRLSGELGTPYMKYHYGKFLIRSGRKEEGLSFLRKSAYQGRRKKAYMYLIRWSDLPAVIKHILWNRACTDFEDIECLDSTRDGESDLMKMHPKLFTRRSYKTLLAIEGCESCCKTKTCEELHQETHLELICPVDEQTAEMSLDWLREQNSEDIEEVVKYDDRYSKFRKEILDALPLPIAEEVIQNFITIIPCEKKHKARSNNEGTPKRRKRDE
jgi:TPR repeat protein